jgi:hypothetical protein
MKYEEMSDLVIDRKVFVKMYGECIGDKDMNRVWKDNKFRPCSNPSGAWPIIVENKIAIDFIDGYGWTANPAFNCSISVSCHDEPLRAAMICFLKMKDAE